MVSREAPNRIVQDSSGSNHVIMQRPDGTEVALLDPPYRVQRPVDFQPAYMSVSIVRLEGFNERSIHTIHVSFDGTYRHCRLYYNPEARALTPHFEEAFEWEISPNSLDLQLDLRVFEQKRPRNKRKKLAAHESVSLNFLDVAAGTRVSHSRLITLPCHKDPSLSIVFQVHYQSDYAHWLLQELEARRKEEALNSSMSNTTSTASGSGLKIPYFSRVEVEPAPAEPNYDFTDLCCMW